MAKNRLPGDYPRDTTINIRVSKAERALIRRAAESRGISVSAYLIGLALGDQPTGGCAHIGFDNQYT